MKTSVYVCSLDVEKCFDRIWNAGLLYKLIDVVPLNVWLLLYRWYTSLSSVVRWQGKYSSNFTITHIVRQGSILSPTLLNIYTSELIYKIKNECCGIRIGDEKINSMSYVDDITLLSTTVPGLQKLINL